MNKLKSRSDKIFTFYKNPAQTVTYIYDKSNFKERKIFIKDNKSEYLSDGEKKTR